MDATGAVITFAVGLGGVALGGLLARRNEKRSANDRLLVESINDLVGAIAEVAGGATGEAQWRYGSAVSRIALHAPPEVVSAFRAFQDDATTATPEGRARLIAAVQSARRALGRDGVAADDLAVLLFGAHRGSFELAWAEQQTSLGAELVEAGATGAGGLPVRTDEALDQARALVESSPSRSIERAYEAIVTRLAELAGSGAGASNESSHSLEPHIEAGLVSENTAHAIRGVATMRNLAMHAPGEEPTARHAADFLALADGVLFAIDADARKQRERR